MLCTLARKSVVVAVAVVVVAFCLPVHGWRREKAVVLPCSFVGSNIDRHHAALATETTIPLIWVRKAFRPGLTEGIAAGGGGSLFPFPPV